VYTNHKNLPFDNFTTDRVHRWKLIAEEYGPEIIYIKSGTNVVADMLSRYPRTEKVVSPTEEVFVIENQPKMFPQSFKVISEAQQQDKQLLEMAKNIPDYSTKKLLQHTIIHYKNKIVTHKFSKNELLNGTIIPSSTRVLTVPQKASINIFIGRI
jgi:hypothetical protein